MNWKQKSVMWVGIVLILALTAFPPFLGSRKDGTDGFIGFHYVFSWPHYTEHHGTSVQMIDGKVTRQSQPYTEFHWYQNPRIDVVRFLMIVTCVGLVCGGLFCSVWSKESKKA